MKRVSRVHVVVLISLLVALTLLAALGSVSGQGKVSLTRITHASPTSRRSELADVSCDGGRIAFKSNSDFHNEGLAVPHIWLYNAQTQGLTRLSPHENDNTVDTTFKSTISADGTKIAFTRRTVTNGPPEIWLATTDPFTVAPLTATDLGFNNLNPSISANGFKIAFVGTYDFLNNTSANGTDLWLVDTINGEISLAVNAVPDGRRIDVPAVNSDGSRIVFTSDADFFGQGIPGGGKDIWLYDTVAKALTQITNGLTSGRNSGPPSISGDGTQIAFVSNADLLNEGNPKYHLWLYNTITKTYTKVTDHANVPSGQWIRDPDISLDGNVIAFVSTYDHIREELNDHQEIWHYHIPSATFTQVTDSTGLPFSGVVINNLEPSANGSGQLVAFHSNVDFFREGDIGFYEIWRAEVTPTISVPPPPPLDNHLFLPLIMRDGSATPPVIWEDDDFDTLPPGPLDGKNGWFSLPNRASAIVSPAPGAGNLLHIDPISGQTIVMGKDVPDQSDGQHTLRLRVRVEAPLSGAGCNLQDPLAPVDSLAKIEVRTNPAGGWEKKFQLYFGSRSMRINFGPTPPEAATIVPMTQLGRWYTIEVTFNPTQASATVLVDGAPPPGLPGGVVPIHPGPVVEIGLSGWDLPGSVQLDDLRGMKH